MKTIKVGDRVLYFGNFGTAEPVEVTVIGIVSGVSRHFKHGGTPVNEMPVIEYEEDCSHIVDLSNYHWGYGFQVKPVE
jgi:hypothetical protein